jgi:hypothetical protein
LTVLVPNTDEAARQRLPGAGARVRLGWLPQHMHLIPAGSTPASDDTDAPGEPAATVPAQPA